MDCCPCCKRHCLKEDLHCEKGRMYFSNHQSTNNDEQLYMLLKSLMYPKKKHLILKLKSHKKVSMKKLEKKFDLSHDECKQNIKLLEKEEKVYRKKEEGEIYIYLTEKGRKEKARLEQQENTSIFSCLDETEKQEFRRLLEKMSAFQKHNSKSVSQ